MHKPARPLRAGPKHTTQNSCSQTWSGQYFSHSNLIIMQKFCFYREQRTASVDARRFFDLAGRNRREQSEMQKWEIDDAVLTVDPIDPSSVLSGNPVVSNRVLWESVDGHRVCGIWEMTPGVVADTESDEMFVVHRGKATIRINDGKEYSIEAGSVGIFAHGTKTVWTVHETLRKAYTINKHVRQGNSEMTPRKVNDTVLNRILVDPLQIVSGAPTISDAVLWQDSSPGWSRHRGIREITRGVVADTTADEFFLVHQGSATIDVEGHGAIAVGPATVGILAAGARARWTVHATLRRAYESYRADAAAPDAAAAAARSGPRQRCAL